MSLGQCNPQSKILWHFDRINDFLSSGSTTPVLFEIDPSNKCNQDCPWCSFSRLRSESQAVMCADKLKEVLDSMWDMGVKAINWTGGGEPLMNKYLPDVIEYAYKKGFSQGMFTNGLLLKKSIADRIVPVMNWIRFSLDGYDEESYAKSHGTSEKSFNVVLDNIRYASSIKKRCDIGVGFIINEDNYHGIETVVLLAKDMGVDYIQLKPVTYRPWEKQISRDVVEYFYDKSIDMEKHSDHRFNVMVTHYRFQDMMSEKHGRNYKKCMSHHFQGAVGADSKVYICDHHKGEKEYELGDLNVNTLQEIWDSDKRKKVIDFLDSSDLSQCQSCCRGHETNKLLWHMANKEESMHPCHI